MSREEVSTERLTREGDRLEADAALVEEMTILVGGVDDREAAAVELEMPLDERQGAAADGAEADHDDRAGDAAVHGPGGHGGGAWRGFAARKWGAG